MKNTINIIITTLVFSLLCSCSMSLNQEQTDVPYYQFNNQDSALIINYNYVPDQIIPTKMMRDKPSALKYSQIRQAKMLPTLMVHYLEEKGCWKTTMIAKLYVLKF